MIWFSVPKQGQFILSRRPLAGYEFRKIAVLKERTISFTYEGRQYQLTSAERIPGLDDGSELWVFHNPDFSLNGRCVDFSCVGTASTPERFVKAKKP